MNVSTPFSTLKVENKYLLINTRSHRVFQASFKFFRKKIIKDIKIYFNIKNILIKKISFAPKVKLINDNNARRDVIVKKEEKIS